MSQSLDLILRYGVPNLKKFEWANSYRTARPSAMTKSNIEGAWNGAGLFPFNPQKIIHRLRAVVTESETHTIIMMTANAATPSPWSNRFNLIPETPSQLDPAILCSANEALLLNINAGILDMPTKAYIPKLIALSEHLHATNIMVQHHNESLTTIVKKRKIMATGKCAILKDQTLMTTEDLYQKLK